MFLEITAYYYSVLIAFALLHERDFLVGPAICAFSVISLILTTYWESNGLSFVHAGMSASLLPLVLLSTWRAGLPPSTDLTDRAQSRSSARRFLK